MKHNELKIIVCLPTYNEVDAVELMIDGIISQGFELLITDGGSTDGTVQNARKKGVMVLERPGHGKGYGMHQAIEFATEKNYQVIVFIDCDMTYPTDKIPELVKEINDYDMIVGARRMAGIEWPNRIANYLFTGIINLLYQAHLKDTLSGMKALKISQFRDIITANGFEADLEICCKAIRRNYATKEIEIDYYPRVGESKSGVVDGLKILYIIIKCLF